MRPRYLVPVAIVVLAPARAGVDGDCRHDASRAAAARRCALARRLAHRVQSRRGEDAGDPVACGHLPLLPEGRHRNRAALARHHAAPLVVYNVWQPVLPTDWGQPGTGALARLSDPRVRQFWDSDRLLARAVEHSSEGRTLQPNCCFERGLWWDFIAVYPPGATVDRSLARAPAARRHGRGCAPGIRGAPDEGNQSREVAHRNPVNVLTNWLAAARCGSQPGCDPLRLLTVHGCLYTICL